jgi:hypothetical protein
MVNANKHEVIRSSIRDDLVDEKQLNNVVSGLEKGDFSKCSNAELSAIAKPFYMISKWLDEIITYAETNFEKELIDVDVMDIAIYILHGIVTAESDDMKNKVKETLCTIIDDKYALNEFIYTKSNEILAVNNVAAKFIKDGEFNAANSDAIVSEINKKVKEFEYKAWNDELKVIKRNADKSANGGD